MQGETHIIQLGEHTFTTPPEPPRKEILFHNLPKKEQYWKRSAVIKDIPPFFFDWHRDVEEDALQTMYDDRGVLLSLSREDTTKLMDVRDQEIRRMMEGAWFMNNGIATYITGGHYAVLMWLPMLSCINHVEAGSQYAAYLQFQRNYCYIIEVAKTTKVAKGVDVVKPKKTGITYLQALLFLADAMTHRGSYYRIMSIKEETAKKVNFACISFAVEKLPQVLTPDYRKNLGAIFFENSDTTSKRSSRKKSLIDFLHSGIETVATVNNAFDSSKNAGAWVDEQSKIKDGADPEKIHNITLNSVMQGVIRIGYIIYTHYVSDINDDSYEKARTIYYDSKLRTIDPATGRTKSGLICYALLAKHGIFGLCDKYGDPDVEGINEYINTELNQRKNNPGALRSWRRQMPTSEEDCWQEGAGEYTIFNNIRLGEKKHKLDDDESVANFPYFDFNFEWTASPIMDEVAQKYSFPGTLRIKKFSHDERMNGVKPGVFKWYRPEWTPSHWLEKNINKLSRDSKGQLKPRENTPFYASVDPTQYSGAKDVTVASNNAMQVFVLPDAELNGIVGKMVTNKRLIVEYLYRPDSPRETLMHVIQTILYFGCYVLVESNAAWLATRLKEVGLGSFLILVNKDTGLLEPYRGEWAEQKLFISQKSERGGTDTIGDYVMAGKAYLNEVEPIDNIETLESTTIIKQLMDFDPENTRRFDAAVCFLVGQMGMNAYLGWKVRSSKKGRPDTQFKDSIAAILH